MGINNNINNMNKVFFVTGNQFKFDLAKSKLSLDKNINLKQKKIDCVEIQADTIEEVAIYSVKYSVKKIGEACIKNDSGLVIPALKGFPGPYTSYIEQTIGEKGILSLMESINNRKAKFIEVLAFAQPNKKPITFKCITEGNIARKAKGEYGWSFDKIFIPQGYDKTLAEFKDKKRLELWDSSGYRKLSEYLNKMYYIND
jgi:XTP/dITP diphosphohydrolase